MRTPIQLLWLLVILGALAITTTHTTELAAARTKLLEDPPLAHLGTPLIDLATLGHRGLWDDFADIWILQILVDPRLAHETPENVFATIHAVTRHNPKLESLYMISCFVLGLDFQRPDLCEPITIDGLKAFPNSWRIPVTQGFFSYYRLNDPKKAAVYYGLAASRPGSPEFLKKLVRNLTAKNGLSVTELQETVDQLIDVPGGSKFGDFLKDRSGSSKQGRP